MVLPPTEDIVPMADIVANGWRSVPPRFQSGRYIDPTAVLSDPFRQEILLHLLTLVELWERRRGWWERRRAGV